MKENFNNLGKHIAFAFMIWLVVSAGVMIACKHGIMDCRVAIFISLCIIWVAVAIFLFKVFSIDGRQAWNSRNKQWERIIIRILLAFYASCAIALMFFSMKEMIIFLL